MPNSATVKFTNTLIGITHNALRGSQQLAMTTIRHLFHWVFFTTDLYLYIHYENAMSEVVMSPRHSQFLTSLNSFRLAFDLLG